MEHELGLRLMTIFISINLSTIYRLIETINFSQKTTILLKNILINQMKYKFLWNSFLKQK